MSPRSPSVNEELRRRSQARLLQATVELVDERGYEATTLADIADRAGRGPRPGLVLLPGQAAAAADGRAPADAHGAGPRVWSGSRARRARRPGGS